MSKLRSKTIVSSRAFPRHSQLRRALYIEDLARARRQTPEEKLKIALELSNLCLKLKRALQNGGRGYGKA